MTSRLPLRFVSMRENHCGGGRRRQAAVWAVEGGGGGRQGKGGSAHLIGQRSAQGACYNAEELAL